MGYCRLVSWTEDGIPDGGAGGSVGGEEGEGGVCVCVCVGCVWVCAGVGVGSGVEAGGSQQD